MNLLFTDTGWKQYTEWQGQDKKIIKCVVKPLALAMGI